MRQLYDGETRSFSYLIWDKTTEDAIIIDPVRDQVCRDLVVCTNLNLVYVVNSKVHDDFITGVSALKRKVKGLKSVISKESGADADEKINDGDQIHFGHRHIIAIKTPSQSSGCMSFLLDDNKAIIVHGFNKMHKLPDGGIVMPGHDFDDGGSTDALVHEFHGKTMDDFVSFLKNTKPKKSGASWPKKFDAAFECNMKEGANPFNVRSLRSRAKYKWGVFG
ncbi:hypothetical protein ACHAXS_005655 [Conticribra weissflogii]